MQVSNYNDGSPSKMCQNKQILLSKNNYTNSFQALSLLDNPLRCIFDPSISTRKETIENIYLVRENNNIVPADPAKKLVIIQPPLSLPSKPQLQYTYWCPQLNLCKTFQRFPDTRLTLFPSTENFLLLPSFPFK